MRCTSSLIGVSLIALLSAPAFALPSGSPICNADVGKLKAAHGSDSAEIGYALDVQKKGEAFEIKVKNSGAQKDYKGLLMYIVGKDENVHLGSFKGIDSANFKFVTSGCQGGSPESTVTHSNGNSKPLSSAFMWTPSPGDEAKGPFKVVSIVTAGKSPWQKLADVPLELGGGKAAAPSGPAAPTTPSAPATPVLPPMGTPYSPTAPGAGTPYSPTAPGAGTPYSPTAPLKFKCRRIQPASPAQLVQPQQAPQQHPYQGSQMPYPAPGGTPY